MDYFNARGKHLYCEGIKVANLVKKFGTPLYVYSSRTILDHFEKIRAAFLRVSPLLCYSVKANSNLSILKLLTKAGAGLDIVSGGELYRAKQVGCTPKKIVYASVGKSEREIKQAINYGIFMFNVESASELNRLNRVAESLRKKVNVALRVNPDINPYTHAYITTGKKETKFGIDLDQAKALFLSRDNFRNLNIIGVHIHIGSQITQVVPYIKAIEKILKLLDKLKAKGVSIEYFNIGGGLGIIYDKDKPQTAREFARAVLPLLKRPHLKIILEPGRFIVGNAGILVTQVLYIKDNPSKKFIIVDAAMNDLMRPALYGAYHKILALTQSTRRGTVAFKKVDVVGPVCEAGDFLGKDRLISAREGDYLAVMGAGAYGFSMSSNYNSRTRVAEVLVKNNKAYLIRKRETYQDLIAKEIVI